MTQIVKPLNNYENWIKRRNIRGEENSTSYFLIKKASMDISTDTITIKKAEYGFQLSDLLTKKKKNNWNEKVPKKNGAVVIPNRSKEN